MYSFNARVRYSEVGGDRRLSVPGVVNYLQDCSTFQSEDLKLGIDYLEQSRRAWWLSSWQIVVERYPQLGEEIVVSTWPYDFKSFLGYRNFTLESSQGELLAYADSIWVLLDLRRGRPMRGLPKMLEVYQLSPRFPMERAPRKLSLPEGMEPKGAFPVGKYHIDTNQHVNNGKYVSMAQEYLPLGFAVKRMRAEYRKAAVYGDIICPMVIREGARITVNLANEEGMPFEIVELEGD